MNVKITCSTILSLVVFASSSAFALPTQVIHQDTPACDPLFIPTLVDEIGDFTVFPADEALGHLDLGLANPVCTATDLPFIPDALVSIRNLTGRDLQEVWYIADKETTITNFDGEANDIAFAPLQEAFRLDHDISDPFGTHHPLVFESGPFDGIWQAGEEWRFVLQDYTNTLGLAPDAITSRGVGDASFDLAGVASPSSGSIIAIPSIPEPASAVLALLGMSLSAFVVRRQRS